ncbi:MAG: alternative ribosome rescue aminoacyl-tRNA hydrolase ArfB [Bacteroidales bacterium]|jgi:ribosome-associated protein|nr:alternative ribosome rescue aminoacyl-tRNA hydrolase ArfB [Bacteroidales bacterium]
MISKEVLLKELTFKAVRSSGSGGQHVNKVSTKVELRFDVDHSEGLSPEEKARIITKLSARISKEGILIITSDTARTQLRNKNQAIELFFELLEQALKKPKKRKKTKPTRSSKEKRLKAKKIQAEKKQLRKGEL